MRKIRDVIRRWLDRLVEWRGRPMTLDQVETDDPMQAEARRRMHKKIFDLNLRVLLFHEQEKHHAQCLEMDLIGVGNTEKAALKELQELVEEHISFAVFKNDDGLLFFNAEQEFFDRWEKIKPPNN